jgi:hypothetical protein
MSSNFRGFKSISLLMVLITIAFLTSCSSIFNGDMQEVQVKSTPATAKIFLNGNYLGETPGVIKLKRGETHIIEIKKDGFQTFKITTSKTITGWFWGNLLCGGVLGFIIDLATGNAYDVEPAYINAVLDKGVGMNEKYQFENFTSINVKDPNGANLGSVNIVWE